MLPPRMENDMEKTMENEVETGAVLEGLQRSLRDPSVQP